MTDIRCLLGIHDYERVSEPVPARGDNEFDFIVNSYALGKCRRCPKFSMVRCCGGLKSYYFSEVETKREWLKILVAKLEG